ncbi:hypothetical protein [Lysobacter sp. HA35]
MADTFALSLAAFAAKAPGQARQVVRKVAIDALTRVVMRTPVGNPSLWKGKPPAGYVGGRLRANWVASIGVPSIDTTTARDAGGSSTIARGTGTIAAADGLQPIYLMNSLPYAREIEYESHSRQAPAGMVRITVTEFQTMVDAAARSLT